MRNLSPENMHAQIKHATKMQSLDSYNTTTKKWVPLANNTLEKIKPHGTYQRFITWLISILQMVRHYRRKNVMYKNFRKLANECNWHSQLGSFFGSIPA